MESMAINTVRVRRALETFFRGVQTFVVGNEDKAHLWLQAHRPALNFQGQRLLRNACDVLQELWFVVAMAAYLLAVQHWTQRLPLSEEERTKTFYILGGLSLLFPVMAKMIHEHKLQSARVKRQLARAQEQSDAFWESRWEEARQLADMRGMTITNIVTKVPERLKGRL